MRNGGDLFFDLQPTFSDFCGSAEKGLDVLALFGPLDVVFFKDELAV